MIALLDTTQDLAVCEKEIGMECGQLITPHSGRNQGRKFAIDNGAYKNFDRGRFEGLLRRELPNRERCLFVAAPDVVGSARRTMEAFHYWYPRLCGIRE